MSRLIKKPVTDHGLLDTTYVVRPREFRLLLWPINTRLFAANWKLYSELSPCMHRVTNLPHESLMTRSWPSFSRKSMT